MTSTSTTVSPDRLPADSELTVAEAALVAGKSFDTIKRKRAAGAYPGAHRRAGDGRETWLIPVTDLVAAGDLPATALVDPAGYTAEIRETRRVQDLQDANAGLAKENAALAAEVQRLEQERDWLRRLHENRWEI
jgi:hypothetical protein